MKKQRFLKDPAICTYWVQVGIWVKVLSTMVVSLSVIYTFVQVSPLPGPRSMRGEVLV
jgi:hypothetical protein